MVHTQSLGKVIDDLELTQSPAPDEEVLGAVVLLKVRGPDGEVSLRSLWSDDLGWMERVGMHTIAAQNEVPAAAPGDTSDYSDYSAGESGWQDRWDEGLDDQVGISPLHAVDTGPEARGDSRPGARYDAVARTP